MNRLKQLFTVVHYKNYIKHVTAFMLYACLNHTSHAVISILHSKECFNYYIKCNDIWHGKCLHCGNSKSVWSNSQRIQLQTAPLINTYYILSQISKLSDIIYTIIHTGFHLENVDKYIRILLTKTPYLHPFKILPPNLALHLWLSHFL